MIRVDPNNLPDYMQECITEDFDDCGVLVDRKTGDIYMAEELAGQKVNVEKLKEHFIMISKDM